MNLKPDIHCFDPDSFGTLAELRSPTDPGAADILIVGCCDQGTALDVVSIADTERTYIVQNLGSSVPPSGASDGGTTLAGIEFAVQHLNVDHAVVCGHSGCRVIANWLAGNGHGNQCHEAQRFRREVCSLVDREYPRVSADDRLSLVIREQVLSQLENLQSHEVVRSALRAGRLRLHGWVVDDHTARVHRYDPNSGQFVSPSQVRQLRGLFP